MLVGLKNRLTISHLLTGLTILSFMSLGYFLFLPDFALARSEYPWVYFLVGIIFFNTTHIFITFIKINYLPEFKSLKFLKSKSFIARCGFIFLATFLVTALCSIYGQHTKSIAILLRVFIFSTTIHHANMQSYGLSNQLNLHSKYNTLEKRLVLIFTGIAIILYLLSRMDFLKITQALAVTTVVLWLIIAVYVVKQTAAQVRFEKSIFMIRYLCVFLSFIHPLFTLMSMTFHGLEYLQTFLRLRSRSKIETIYLRVTSFFLWVAVPLTALFIHYSTVISMFDNLKLSFLSRVMIESTVMGLNVLHYFLDAKIYQFKSVEVKQKISPLFRTA